jgi:hypothetical protein
MARQTMNIAEELFDIKPKLQRINSKEKGDRNELNVAHLITAWTGHEFERVPRSGGLHWKNRGDVCGDVINTDREFYFPYSVETKFYKNLGLKQCAPYIRSNSIIYRFMEQCKQDAIAAKKMPFLMVRENGMSKDEYYIFLPINFLNHAEFLRYTTFQYIGWNQDIAGFRSSIFFKNISYELFKTIYHE